MQFGFINVHFFCDRSFKFRFHCEQGSLIGGQNLKGTGGRFLQELVVLLSRLFNLRELELKHLLLDSTDAAMLLDGTLHNSGDTLTVLRVIDCAKSMHPFLHAGLFFKLQKLVISPNHIDDDVVNLLSFTNIKTVTLYQDEYTCLSVPASWSAWKELRKNVPNLRVELFLTGPTRSEMVLQPRAPVQSILYNTPYSVMKVEVLLFIIENYSETLKVFGHQLLPKEHRLKSFRDRPDSSLVHLARNCTSLHTLIIRERVSTATLLIIASIATKLEHLYVRRNAVILLCDWPHNPLWTTDFYEWLKASSVSYELVEKEISEKLGKQWNMMSDQDFNNLGTHA